ADEAEEEDEEDAVRREVPGNGRVGDEQVLVKKILQQEPEMLPFHASASPLSPQISAHNTPRLGPSIKVSDPYNVLFPPVLTSRFNSDGDGAITEVYLICHGECHMKLRPDLIAGRCPDAALTPNGRRQARALAVFLKSLRVRFNAVYTSTLDRARATAISVCQELNFSEENIQLSDSLVEMSQGQWEGCHRSEVFTPETVTLMDKFQPDFCAPAGESLRQVEFRMVRFLNTAVVPFPDKCPSDFSARSSWDSSLRQHLLLRKKSGKSRLQMVTKTSGDHDADDEMVPSSPRRRQDDEETASCCVGVFSHSTPIRCLLTGVLGCSPAMSSKMCVDESSVTVLQHSWRHGWQIKRFNDTSHLRLL
ncbi:hypothetical protein M569_15033, partial [Genlisea aurea]